MAIHENKTDGRIILMDDYVVMGDSIMQEIACFYHETDIESVLCRKDLTLRKLRREITQKPIPKEYEKIIISIGIDEINSDKFDVNDHINQIKEFIKELNKCEFKKIIICQIPPQPNRAQDVQHWRNLEEINKTYFRTTQQLQKILLFDSLRVLAYRNHIQDGTSYTYVTHDEQLKYNVYNSRFIQDGVHWSPTAKRIFLKKLDRSISKKWEEMSSKNAIIKPIENKIGPESLKNIENPTVDFSTLGSIREIISEDELKPSALAIATIPSRVLINIGKIALTALVDTGAAFTFVRQDVASYLKRKSAPVEQCLDHRAFSGSITGSIGSKSERPSEVLTMTLTFPESSQPDQKVYINFLVLSCMNETIIIGQDCIQAFNIDVSNSEKCIKIEIPNSILRIKIPFTTQNNVKKKLLDNILYEDISSSEGNESYADERFGLNAESQDKLYKLTEKYKFLFRDEIGKCSKYVHSFLMKPVEEVKSRNIPIPHKYKGDCDKIIDLWKEQGIIERTYTTHRTPLLPVVKPNGSVRLVGDYRNLNKYIKMKTNDVPKLEEIKYKLQGAKYFTTLDFSNGFLQIPLAPESRPYTSFIYGHEAYQFTRVPYGTKDSMAAFIAAMQNVLEGVDNFAISYVDDILVYSKTLEEHFQHIEIVLKKIQEAGMTLNISKTTWISTEIHYLGMIVNKDGTCPDPEKVQSIKEYPIPRNLKQLQSFLGMVNFYRTYIPKYSDIARPLHDLTQKDRKFRWTENEENAFEELKNSLANAALQSHPDFEKEFFIYTDASDFAIAGAIFQKTDEGTFKPLVFSSRSLVSAERNYSTYEKEVLAIVYTLLTNDYMLFGRKITVYTDNRAASLLMTSRLSSVLNQRINRWTTVLCNFDIELIHVKGSENPVADTLSRYHKLLKKEESNSSINYFEVELGFELESKINNIKEIQEKDQFVIQELSKGEESCVYKNPVSINRMTYFTLKIESVLLESTFLRK